MPAGPCFLGQPVVALLPLSESHHVLGCHGRKRQACFGKLGVAGGPCEPPGRDARHPAPRNRTAVSANACGRPAPWALQGRSRSAWVGASGPRSQGCLALTIGHGAVLGAVACFLPPLASTPSCQERPCPSRDNEKVSGRRGAARA